MPRSSKRFGSAGRSKTGVSTVIAGLAVIIALAVAGIGGYALRGSSGSSASVSFGTETIISNSISTVVQTAPPSSTVEALNATVTTVAVGPFYGALEGIVYDPANNDIYAAMENLGSVVVLNAATGATVTTINLTSGYAPIALAYDSANGMIYVANDDSSTCSPSTNSTCAVPVIDTSNNTVVANIPTPDETSDVAVNPTTGVVYAPSNDDDATFFLNATTNQYAGELQNHTQIPDNSEVVAVDTAKNLGFVANSYYHNQPLADVGFLANPSAGGCMFKNTNESSDCVTKSLGVLGGKIDGIAVDATTGLIYVSNYNLDLVNVISESTGADVANITVQSPTGIALNPTSDMVYVGSNTTNSAGNDTLYVIDGSTNSVLGTVTVGFGPANVAIDTAANTVLVSNTSDGTISVVQESGLTS